MRLWRRLDTPRRAALAVAVVCSISGLLMVGLALDRRVSVPAVGASVDDRPTMSYVRSLPDAGEADFVRPVGLAVGNGRLYVADSGAAVVRVFTTSGIGAGIIGEGILGVPAYLAVDEATGTVLVTDRSLGALLRFDEDGARIADLVPSNETTGSWEPLAVAVDGDGTVAVSDSSGRHRLLIMDRDGDVAFQLGGSDPIASPGSVSVALDYPNCIALSDSGIWVSDSNNRRVLMLDRDGAYRGSVVVGGIARGVAYMPAPSGSERYVAIVDALASEILLIADDGTPVTAYGEPGSAAGQLAFPNDVAYDRRTSQLFVADTGNARVQVWEVEWPDERSAVRAAADRLGLTPMQVFGLGLALLGLVAGAIALLSGRRRPGMEPAIVEDTT